MQPSTAAAGVVQLDILPNEFDKQKIKYLKSKAKSMHEDNL